MDNTCSFADREEGQADTKDLHVPLTEDHLVLEPGDDEDGDVEHQLPGSLQVTLLI